MKKPLGKLNNIIKSVVSLALVLWLSGATCMFGCEMVKETENSATKNSRSMSSDHSCCKRAKGKKEISPLQKSPSSPMHASCCPLAQPPTEQARKSTTQTAPSVVSINNFSWLASSNIESQTFVPSRVRLPDRGGTHIKNCIFLI